MQITVNGKLHEIKRSISILEYLTLNKINPLLVVVEYNNNILTKEDLDKVCLHDGDNIEVVKFIGGG